jgi:hypothetical protein
LAPIGLAPPGRVREGAGARGRELGQMVEGEGDWANFLFFFYSEFLIPFLFIFFIKFKSNQTTNSNLNISNMCINQKQSFKLSMM